MNGDFKLFCVVMTLQYIIRILKVVGSNRIKQYFSYYWLMVNFCFVPISNLWSICLMKYF